MQTHLNYQNNSSTGMFQNDLSCWSVVSKMWISFRWIEEFRDKTWKECFVLMFNLLLSRLNATTVINKQRRLNWTPRYLKLHYVFLSQGSIDNTMNLCLPDSISQLREEWANLDCSGHKLHLQQDIRKQEHNELIRRRF